MEKAVDKPRNTWQTLFDSAGWKNSSMHPWMSFSTSAR